MLSGLSTDARIASDELLTRVVATERNVRARAAEIARAIQRNRKRRLTELHLNLLLEEPDRLVVLETQTRERFNVSA